MVVLLRRHHFFKFREVCGNSKQSRRRQKKAEGVGKKEDRKT
jgi:hypothetical protein